MRKYINYEQGEYNDLLCEEEYYHHHTGWNIVHHGRREANDDLDKGRDDSHHGQGGEEGS